MCIRDSGLTARLIITIAHGLTAVSYTHLDVYKRQILQVVLFVNKPGNVLTIYCKAKFCKLRNTYVKIQTVTTTGFSSQINDII